MRAIAFLVVAGLIAVARPASAEPQAAPGKKDKKQQVEKRGAPTPDPAAQPGYGLGSVAAMAARAAEGATRDVDAKTVETRRLDLTPRRQLDSGVGTRADRRGSERGTGIALPDDTDWKVQAVQVGGMAALFGALVAVCGGGRCLLPGADDASERIGPPPGLQVRPEPKLRDPR
jgi:hypothetical protein